MPSITAPGFPVVEPRLVLGYSASRQTRNIVHGTIDPANGNPYYTLAEAGPRSGQLALLFDNQDDATACFDLHGLRLVFSFEHEQRHTWAMSYIADGEIEIELDDERKMFTVTIPFLEVTS